MSNPTRPAWNDWSEVRRAAALDPSPVRGELGPPCAALMGYDPDRPRPRVVGKPWWQREAERRQQLRAQDVARQVADEFDALLGPSLKDVSA